MMSFQVTGVNITIAEICTVIRKTAKKSFFKVKSRRMDVGICGEGKKPTRLILEKVYLKSQILVHEYWTILDHFCIPVL